MTGVAGRPGRAMAVGAPFLFAPSPVVVPRCERTRSGPMLSPSPLFEKRYVRGIADFDPK